MLTAITRCVSPAFRSCQLEYLARQEIDLAQAVAQHSAYEACLRDLGVRVISLPADDALADCVFIEDAAIVLDEVAAITRMGTPSRRPEVEIVADALSAHRPLQWITEPATIEGGDVMRCGRTLYVGLSRRTNQEGIAQLRAIASPLGYDVVPVAVHGCMHLKTGCSWLGDGRVLMNKDWIESRAFSDFESIEVPQEEPWAANVLRIDDVVVLPSGFPRTGEQLQKLGLKVRCVDICELAKAEAGVTCMSLIFQTRLHR